MRVVFLLLLLFSPLSLHAQEVTFDTLASLPVGPGVIHTEINVPEMPWTIDVLEVDLTNPYIEVETAKAAELLNGSRETTTSMARRHDGPGRTVVGGVNGDFFSGGRPISIQVKEGEILQKPITSRPAFGFDAEKNFTMPFPALDMKLILPTGTTPIHDVNDVRGTDELILYNHYWGATTRTNQYGTELLVRPIGGWRANDTLRLVIEAVEANKGATNIPDDAAVLSGHGTSAAMLQANFAVGDTATVYLGVGGIDDVVEMIGGGPTLVLDGKSSVGPRGDGGQVHPRTAIGISADSTRLFLITVDGRQNTSAGIHLPDLAHFMTLIGVHTGMNLDGGGSTTMVVNHKIVNSPSDGAGERPVANALLVVSTAPRGGMSQIQMRPQAVRLFMGQHTDFAVHGTDAFSHPVSIDGALLRYEVDPALGTIDAEGTFTAGVDADTGYVYAIYDNAYTDSSLVIVKTVDRMIMSPEVVATDTSRVVPFTIRAFDQDGLEQSVPLGDFTWSVTDPAVGTIDAQGRFKAHGTGTTHVVAQWRSVSDTSAVTVEVQQDGAQLGAMESLEGWTLSGENVDLTATTLSLSNEHHSDGEAAFRVDYRFTYDPAKLNLVYLETDLPIAGVPDSLFFDVRSDGRRHRVFYDVLDVEEHAFQLYAAAYADEDEAFKTLPSAFARAIPKSGYPEMYFPVRLQRIVLQLASDRKAGEVYEGTLYLDNLRLTYPTRTTATEGGPLVPGRFELLPNYPNPFGAETTLAYALPHAADVRLAVYDLLGRAVRTLVDAPQGPGRHAVTLDAAGLPAGLYFVRLQAGQTVQTRTILHVR